jgi:hypothetical protein
MVSDRRAAGVDPGVGELRRGRHAGAEVSFPRRPPRQVQEAKPQHDRRMTFTRLWKKFVFRASERLRHRLSTTMSPAAGRWCFVEPLRLKAHGWRRWSSHGVDLRQDDSGRVDLCADRRPDWLWREDHSQGNCAVPRGRRRTVLRPRPGRSRVARVRGCGGSPGRDRSELPGGDRLCVWLLRRRSVLSRGLHGAVRGMQPARGSRHVPSRRLRRGRSSWDLPAGSGAAVRSNWYLQRRGWLHAPVAHDCLHAKFV